MAKIFHYEEDDPVPFIDETMEEYHKRILEDREARKVKTSEGGTDGPQQVS